MAHFHALPSRPNGRGVELPGDAIFAGVIDRDDDFFADDPRAAEQAADGHFALFVGLDRNDMRHLPLAYRADREATRDGGDAVLFGLVNLAFGIVHSRSRDRLHAKSNAGDHGGIARGSACDSGGQDAGTHGGCLRQHGRAAAKKWH